MEPVKIQMNIQKVTWAYVVGHYAVFMGGILSISYAIFQLLFNKEPIEDSVFVFLSLLLGIFGIVTGGKVVYGQKIIRRKY